MIDQSGTVALITGASRGLGREIARLYARQGYRLIVTAREPAALDEAARELSAVTEVVASAGDVADSVHAAALVRTGLERFGRIDLLVNNASELGPSPMPALEAYPLERLRTVLDVNVLAPLHLIQLVLPGMQERRQGIIINVSSDAGVEAYPGWGGYGAGKAALEHVSRTLAAELEGSGVRVYAVDPGDMNTEMHRLAEPGVDLSDLPGPEAMAPAFLRLAQELPPSGRFRAPDLIGELHHARG